MRFGDLEIPEALIEAQEKGRLVVFCGAGVSVPSGLPSFDQLEETIRQRAEQTVRSSQMDQAPDGFDRFFGWLEDQDYPLRRQIVEELTPTGTQPNSLHRSIVDLFEKPETVRIVTTNFDRLFEGPLRNRFADEIPIFAAPGLPVGSRFHGLVYLHGRVDQAEDMVLTDADFGLGYLTEGWAQRFVLDLFSTFDVLFVGYSHGDPVMRYLARGLGTAKRAARRGPRPHLGLRFALSSGPAEDWKEIGVERVLYSDQDGHSFLRVGLESWAEHVQRSPTEHEEKTKELVNRPLESLGSEAESYLVWALNRREMGQFFYRHALAPGWISWWFEHRDEYPTPFSGHLPGDQSLVRRAIPWLLNDCLSERGERVLMQLEDLRLASPERLADGGAYAILRELNRDAAAGSSRKLRNRRIGLWFDLVVRRHPQAAAGPCESWLANLDPVEDRALWFQVLNFLLTPRVEFSSSSARLNQSIKEITGEIEEGMYRAGGESIRLVAAEPIRSTEILSRLQGCTDETQKLSTRDAQMLLTLAKSHLQMADGLLMTRGHKPSSLSVKRSKIQEDRRSFSSGIDCLVELGREALLALIKQEPDLGRAEVVGLLEAPNILLQRIGIHCFALLDELNVESRLQRLIEEDWLYRGWTGAEAEYLLTRLYPRAIASRPAVLSYLRGPYEEACKKRDPESIARRAMRLHALLLELRAEEPSCRLLKKEVAELRKLLPGSEQKHQTVRRGIPKTAAEVICLIDAQESNGGLFEVEKMIWEATRNDPDWALKIFRDLLAKGSSADRACPVLLRALTQTNIESDRIVEVLKLLSDHRDVLRHSYAEAAQFLRHQLEFVQGAPELLLKNAFKVAQLIWPNCKNGEGTDGIEDVDSVTRRNPVGALGSFLSQAFPGLARQKDARIFDEAKSLLEEITGVPSGRVSLCTSLAMFHHLDSEWTKEHLFSLFDWEADPEAAVQCWHGFLWGRRIPRKFVEDFLPIIQACYPHTEKLGEKIRRRFNQLILALIDLYFESPLDESWFQAYLRDVDPEDRAQFASEINATLRDREPAERAALWDQWLGDYMGKRLKDHPPLDDEEWRWLVSWAPFMAARLKEIVPLVEKKEVPDETHEMTLYAVCSEQQDYREELLEASPELTARLLLALIKNKTTMGTNGDLVAGMCREFRARKVDTWICQKIENHYVRLGGSGTFLSPTT